MKNIYRILTAMAVGFSLLSIPVMAQTTVYVPANQISIPQGYSSAGTGNPNLFSRSTTGTRDQVNPDIITIEKTLVREATSGNTDYLVDSNPNDSGWWNAECETFAYVNKDCTVLSIADHDKGSSPVFDTKTTVTPGGVTVINTCTTDTVEFIGYDPNTQLFGLTYDSKTSDC